MRYLPWTNEEFLTSCCGRQNSTIGQILIEIADLTYDMAIKQSLIIAFVLAISAVAGRAKAWRDITPMHSTRAEVIEAFPQCRDSKSRCIFDFEGAEVMIIFSSGEAEEKTGCSKVPIGTVLLIKLRLRDSKPRSAFKFSAGKVRTFDPANPKDSGYKAYYHAKDGIILSTYKGRVVQAAYLASQPDIARCPQYYEDPEGFVEVGLLR
jgi:hypothetical protein